MHVDVLLGKLGTARAQVGNAHHYAQLYATAMERRQAESKVLHECTTAWLNQVRRMMDLEAVRNRGAGLSPYGAFANMRRIEAPLLISWTEAVRPVQQAAAAALRKLVPHLQGLTATIDGYLGEVRNLGGADVSVAARETGRITRELDGEAGQIADHEAALGAVSRAYEEIGEDGRFDGLDEPLAALRQSLTSHEGLVEHIETVRDL